MFDKLLKYKQIDLDTSVFPIKTGKTATVGELIKKLQEIPPETPVILSFGCIDTNFKTTVRSIVQFKNLIQLEGATYE